jgi:hypothetical protein
VFDSEGIDPEPTRPSRVTVAATPKPGPKHLRHLLRPDQKAIRAQSKLSQSISMSEVDDDYHSDVKSVTSQASCYSYTSQKSQSPSLQTTWYWTQREIRQKEGLPSIWKQICNAPCKRKPLLDCLGENDLPASSLRNSPPVHTCCTRCNPTLASPLSVPLSTSSKSGLSRKGSRATITLAELNKWALVYANQVYFLPNS